MIECRRISTFSCSASSCALRSGRTLKPMMMAFDADASSTSLSVMAPTPECSTLMRTFSFESLASESASTSTEPCTSPLRMMLQFLHACGLDLLGQAFERDAWNSWPAALRAPSARGTRKCRALCRDRPPLRTGRRLAAGLPGRAFRPASMAELLPAAPPRSSNMARTLPKTLPTTKLSPVRSVPFCTSTVATGPRPRSSLASSTTPLPERSGLALSSCRSATRQIISISRFRLVLSLGRDIDEHRGAAPVFRHQAAIRELLLHAIGHGFRLVDLVDRHDDRNFGSLGVIDGFERLRHHAVIGGDHQHHDVGDLGAARTHAGKRFVTRRIEEHDLAPVGRRILPWRSRTLYAPMCCVIPPASPPATSVSRIASSSDGFAVIDVTHDGHHGRTRHSFDAAFFPVAAGIGDFLSRPALRS